MNLIDKKLIDRSVELANAGFYPLFSKPSSGEFLREFIAVHISIALPQNDHSWSVDVLDISVASSPGHRSKFGRIAGNPPAGENLLDDFGFEYKDYPRVEMVFFVRKKWSDEQRILFSALNIARLRSMGLIGIADLERVCTDLELVLREYIFKTKKKPTQGTASFVSTFDASDDSDLNTLKANRAFVTVAFGEHAVARKKKTFEWLRSADSVEVPSDVTFLHHSATFVRMDIEHLEFLESLYLRRKFVAGWDFKAEQRLQDLADPRVELTYLLQERRRNPNRNVDSIGDWEADNQARAAKIWNEYDRYMFRLCNFAVPYAIDSADVELLYKDLEKSIGISTETPPADDSIDDLDKQLIRTRIKQEGDIVIHLKKKHNDVELREKAVSNPTFFDTLI